MLNSMSQLNYVKLCEAFICFKFMDGSLWIKYLWDVIKIEWGKSLCYFEWSNNTVAYISQFPLRDKYRLRYLMRKGSLLLHVILRQGMSWYALDNIEYLLPPPHLEESEI